jgi:hypothetical protein
MRTVFPSRPVLSAFSQIASATRRGWDNMGIRCTDVQWEHNSLPVYAGGSGMRDPEVHAAGAYLASLSECLNDDNGTLTGAQQQALVPITDSVNQAIAPSLAAYAATRRLVTIPSHLPLFSEEFIPISAYTLHTTHFSQRSVCTKLDYARLYRLSTKESLRDSDKVRLTALRAPGVGAFLQAVPRSWGFGRMIAGAFVLAIKLRLGIVAYDEADAGHVCPICLKAPIDAHGRHSICTCTAGGDKYYRHQQLLHIIKRLTIAAGFPTRVDQQSCSVSRTTNACGDARVEGANLTTGLDKVIDVAVTSVAMADSDQYGEEMRQAVPRSAITDHWSISDTYAQYNKINKYAAQIADFNNHAASGMGIDFTPIVFNHWGGLNKAAYGWLSAMAKTRSSRANADGEEGSLSSPGASGTSYLFQELSIALHHANYRMVQKRRSPQDLHMRHVLVAMSGDAQSA